MGDGSLGLGPWSHSRDLRKTSKPPTTPTTQVNTQPNATQVQKTGQSTSVNTSSGSSGVTQVK